MGNDLSRAQVEHLRELGQIVEGNKNFLKQKGCYPDKKSLIKFMKYIWKQCPSYPLKGTIELDKWTAIGKYLHTEPRAPGNMLLTWKAIMMSLRTHYEDGGNCLNDLPKTFVNPKINILTESPPKYEETMITESIPTAPIIKTEKTEEYNLYPSLQQNPVGSLAAGILAARQRSDLDEDDLELLQNYPVQFDNAGVGAFAPMPFQELKNLKSAVVQYGIQSQYTLSMINNLAQNFKLMPCEWRSVAKMLLSGTQYLLWRQAYIEAARDINRQHANVPLDAFLEQGNYATQDQQVRIAQDVFPHIFNAVMTAFSALGDFGSPTSSLFFRIIQQNGEPYDKFVEKLQKAIDRDIKNPEANMTLLRKLAYENANEDCKRVLAPLNTDPNKGIVDFLKAASVVGSQIYKMQILADSLNQAQQPSNPNYQNRPRPRMGNCFNCGKPGHFKNQCRAPGGGAFAGNSRPQNTRPTGPCPKCGRLGHWARECRTYPQDTPSKLRPSYENSGN